jgi:aldehyde:ferredoxin oxidoreductase
MPQSTWDDAGIYDGSDVGAHHNRSWVCGYDVVGDKVGSVHDLIAGGGSANKRPKAAVIGKSVKVIDLQHKRPLFDVLGCCRLQYVEIGFDRRKLRRTSVSNYRAENDLGGTAGSI